MESGGDKYFVMEENDWGFAEPRVLAWSEDNKTLHVVDATSASASAIDIALRRIRRISLHAGDKSTLQLSIDDGTLLQTIVKQVVIAFGSKSMRDRFTEVLRSKLNGTGEEDTQLKYEVDETWQAALPVKHFLRFEVVKLKPRRLPVALLLSMKTKQVYVIKVKEINNYQPGGVIPNSAPVDEILRVAPYRLQLERNARNARVLGMADAGPQHAPTARELTELEFVDGAERERFCGYMQYLASPSDGISIGRTDAVPAGAQTETALISRAPPGNVRSTFRAPSVADTTSLWHQTWPHDTTGIWVGTYNVSGQPPPSDAEQLDKWVPAPQRDPAGPRDLYVFGLQEVGPASNRYVAVCTRHCTGTRTVRAQCSRPLPRGWCDACASTHQLRLGCVLLLVAAATLHAAASGAGRHGRKRW
jgi:hypothetical protein